MFRCVVCIVLISLQAGYIAVYGQEYNLQENFLKANSVWAFGNEAGLNFNKGTPEAIRTAVNSGEGTASVADKDGNLLFFMGDGGIIFNRNYDTMFNSNGLLPYHDVENNTSNTQGFLIVPVIDTPWKYYVFSSLQYEGFVFGGYALPAPYLTYSVVDMKLDNGLGGVEAGRKNIPLYKYALHEALIAVPGENCDIWIIAASAPKTNTRMVPSDPNLPIKMQQAFVVWHITEKGIGMQPQYHAITKSAPDMNGKYLSVSPDRRKIAMGFPNGTLLYDFHPANAVFTNGIFLPNILAGYSTCFSPDSRKLYAAGGGLFQYDITSGDSATMMASEYRVGVGRSLKLYDGIIYVSQSADSNSRSYVGQIRKPNEYDSLCDYRNKAIALKPGTYGGWGLPNQVVYPIIDNAFNIISDSLCSSSGLTYGERELMVSDDYSNYKWDDGSSSNSRVVNAPGVYWVSYRVKDCLTHTDTFKVFSYAYKVSLGEDRQMLFCDHPNAYLELKTNIPDLEATYLWQDGSRLQQYRVTEPGTYWVEVRKDGCMTTDTITVGGVPLDFRDTAFCNGDAIDIRFDLPGLPEGTLVRWNTGSTDPYIRINDTGLYVVRLVNPPCLVTDSIRVIGEACRCSAQVPNAFTPNGDGINDAFAPVIEFGCSPSTYILSIYNRYGERIFQSADLDNAWEGTYKGQAADAGIYFYELYFRGGTGQRQYYYKGDIMLIR